MEAIQPPASGSRGNTYHSTDSPAEDPTVPRYNTSLVNVAHCSENSSLVAR